MDVFITKAYTLMEIFSINDDLVTKHRSNISGVYNLRMLFFPHLLLFEKEKNLSFEMHHYKLM